MSLSRSTLMNSLYESKTHPESILASTSELGLPCFLMASKVSKVISPKAKKDKFTLKGAPMATTRYQKGFTSRFEDYI